MKCEVNGMNAKGYRELSNLIKSGDMDAAREFLEGVQTALAAASEITLLIMSLENDEDCQE
jgi:hypothetical protein